MKKEIGSFAENKDAARDIRKKVIEPALKENQEIILDFSDVEGATQSFIHALLSETYRTYGDDLLEKVLFKNCNEEIKGIINIVIDYLNESV